MRLWAFAALIASGVGLRFLVATSDGLNDYQRRPLGTDFSNVYAAGTLVLEGRPAAPFDPRLHYARQEEFRRKDTFYGWLYPPFFLFVAAALALLPYLLALIVWQGATLLPFICCDQGRDSLGHSRPRQRDEPGAVWLLLALAYPAVFVNLGHGQNGFLTAALFGGALLQLERRPVTRRYPVRPARLQAAVRTDDPVGARRDRTLAQLLRRAATVAPLVIAATLAFGTEIWRAFFVFAEFTRAIVLETGEIGWHKIQSVFSWARMWGGRCRSPMRCRARSRSRSPPR